MGEPLVRVVVLCSTLPSGGGCSRARRCGQEGRRAGGLERVSQRGRSSPGLAPCAELQRVRRRLPLHLGERRTGHQGKLIGQAEPPQGEPGHRSGQAVGHRIRG